MPSRTKAAVASPYQGNKVWSLENLPLEIYKLILSQITKSDLRTLARVSKSLRSIVDSNEVWERIYYSTTFAELSETEKLSEMKAHKLMSKAPLENIYSMYCCPCYNQVIRVVSLKDRRVSTLCGTPQQDGYEDGIHNQSHFSYPRGLGLDLNSNCLYVTDRNNQVVRKVSLSGEVRVSTLCGIAGVTGDRDGLNPIFNYSMGIAVDPHSQSLYVMDSYNRKVKKIIDTQRMLFSHIIIEVHIKGLESNKNYAYGYQMGIVLEIFSLLLFILNLKTKFNQIRSVKFELT